MEVVEGRFQKFRRALRKGDQELADELFRYAKYHIQAGVLAANPNPADSMLFAMLIEQQRRIKDLQTQLQTLKTSESSENRDGDQRLSL